ncbi:MAG: hypothetical protein F6K16_17510 [Symploca sp. SIO2B6]|nr:hypothetical protein [Symploca sp. SIO2B6]
MMLCYFFLKVDTKLSDLIIVERLILEYSVAFLPSTTFSIHQGCYLPVAYGTLSENVAAEGIQRLGWGIK